MRASKSTGKSGHEEVGTRGISFMLSQGDYPLAYGILDEVSSIVEV